MQFGNEVWLYILGALTGGVTWLAKFLQKKFEEKEAEIKKLREEKHDLEIHKARMEERLVKKTTRSRGKNK